MGPITGSGVSGGHWTGGKPGQGCNGCCAGWGVDGVGDDIRGCVVGHPGAPDRVLIPVPGGRAAGRTGLAARR